MTYNKHEGRVLTVDIILDEGTLITFGECNYRILKCIGRGSSAVEYMDE